MVVYRLVVEFKAAAAAAAGTEAAGPLAGWQEAARMKGWRLLPAASPPTFEGSEGVPQAMEFLFDSLQAAKERGEVQEGYEIKLLVDDGVTPATGTAAAPVKSERKKRWAGLF